MTTARTTTPVDDIWIRVCLLESRVRVLEQTVRDLAAAVDRTDPNEAATVIRQALNQLRH
ncbi:hypothetical protein [Dactylosporangium sp. NPDC000521]|uniref:hypothetical protein n=1 Tax=Dactylosporangium sp. NPDC000521 TaxID=3363975 RepID=UPI0036B8CB8F